MRTVPARRGCRSGSGKTEVAAPRRPVINGLSPRTAVESRFMTLAGAGLRPAFHADRMPKNSVVSTARAADRSARGPVLRARGGPLGTAVENGRSGWRGGDPDVQQVVIDGG